ncbi:MAG: hypothetical protein HQL52_15785 [Magnetococcales bacterium]|nr:hypothetical protein [Magnetococcales bacterium]
MIRCDIGIDEEGYAIYINGHNAVTGIKELEEAKQILDILQGRQPRNGDGDHPRPMWMSLAA